MPGRFRRRKMVEKEKMNIKPAATTALIPCFNEVERIDQVLKIITKSPNLQEIIVVDDGSRDNSKKIVGKYPRIKLIVLPKNIGKGGAVKQGLRFVQTPLVFLCDADLRGLKEKHIKKVLEPVKTGRVKICIGVTFKGGIFFQWLRRNILPLIAGTRAVKTNLLKKNVLSPLARDFGLEPYMNFYCNTHNIEIKKVDLKGVSDILKIKKRGLKYFLTKLAFSIKIYFILIFLRLKFVMDKKIG